MESKVCTKCNVVKPLEEYTLRKSGRPSSYCRECNREANRKSYRKYVEARTKAVYEWHNSNLDKVKVYSATGRQRRRQRRKEDPVFNLQCSIRDSISTCFRRACNEQYTKSKKTLDILGCDAEFFVSYISEQFVEGMTLGNHGEWHLDHIIPISSAKTEEDIYRLNHYTNFQPLWAEDNLRKGAKLNWKNN